MKCNKCGRELRDTSSISQIKNCPFCEVSLNEEKTDVKLDGPGMERIKDLLSQMVKCHPGSFMMGSVAPAGILGKILDFFGCAKKSGQHGNEIKHLVRINKDFYIAKYPVTQIQYKTVMGDNPSDSEGDNKPVDVVIRPEDIIISKPGEGIMDGVVTSNIFIGVHYEMCIEAGGFEWVAQNTKSYPVGTRVSISVAPEDIQIMNKPQSEDEEAISLEDE